MWRSWRGLALLVALGVAASLLLGRFGGAGFQDVRGNTALAELAGEAPPGTVTLFVFTDLRCPNCRRDEAAIARADARDPALRVVWKEWPILGPQSLAGARAVLAAGWQGRQAAAHAALMAAPLLDDTGIRDALAGAGIDPMRLERDLAAHGAEIDRRLAATNRRALALGIGGTPGYVAGRWLALGALGDTGLKRLIDRAKAES